MWEDKEWILIHLVWILGWVTCFCCKCKFSYTVIELLACLSWLYCVLVLLRSTHLFGNRSPHILVCRSASRLLWASTQAGLDIDFRVSSLAWGVNRIIDRVGRASLTLIFSISSLIFWRNWLRGWLSNEFTIDVLVVIVITRVLIQWNWLLVKARLLGALITIGCIIQSVVVWLIHLHRWLHSARLWSSVLWGLSWCTGLPPSSISLLHSHTKLLGVGHHGWMLDLLLGQRSQMVRFIIDFGAHYLVVRWLWSIIQI